MYKYCFVNYRFFEVATIMEEKMILRDKVRRLILEEINLLKEEGKNKLPTEQELSSKFGVSRVTLRSALADIEREGKITRRQGSGTYISPSFDNMKLDLFRMKTYGQLIQEAGHYLKVESFITKIVDTPEFVRESKLYDREKMVMTVRIFYADSQIAVVCIDFLSNEYEKNIDELKEYSDSIFEYLKKNHNIKLTVGSIKFHGANDNDLNLYTDIKHKLPKKYLIIEGIEYSIDNEPVLFTKEYINTDIIQITAVRYR